MKHRTLALAVLMFGLTLAGTAAEAAVFNVSNVTGFEDALSTAKNNGQDDKINVAAGIYNVSWMLTYDPAPGETGSLDIIGAGAETTILDGGGTTLVLYFQGGKDITVSGLTIRNGHARERGGGILGFIDGTFTLSDATVSNNSSEVTGGGFYIDGSNVTIANSAIFNNSTDGKGGGGMISGTDVLSVSNSTFNGNSAGTAGGLCIDGGNLVSVTASTFSGNMIGSLDGGGGLFVNDFIRDALAITSSTFSANTVNATCLSNAAGLGLVVFSASPVTFTRNLVDNNTTSCFGNGSGVLLAQGLSTDEVTVADNIFSRNTSGPGSTIGPIHLFTERGTLNVVNNTFSGNDSGEALITDVLFELVEDTAGLNVSNNIFFSDSLEISNDSDGNMTPAPATLRNNIFDPAKVFFEPGGGVSEADNLNVDPLFADPANGDFHITEGSPAIDMGLPAAPGLQGMDFDGDNRLDTPDIGADEFFPDPSFHPQTAVLNVREVQFVSGNSARYDAATKAYEVELTRLDEEGYVFELSSVKKVAASANPAATFNTETGVLDIPVVQVQGLSKTYNVRMQKRPGSFVFDLIKAKKN